MHRRALHTLLLFWCLVCGGSDAPAAELERALVGSERVSVLVSLREPAWSPNRLTRARNLEALRARVLSRSGNAFHASRQYRQVAALSGSITADALEALRRDPEVRDIQLDMIGHGALAEAVPAIGADTVQRVFKVTGRGVRVAVLDTGVEQGADNRGVNTSWVAATQKSEVSGCSISGRQSATRATPGCGGGPHWRSARSYGGVQSLIRRAPGRRFVVSSKSIGR